MTERDARALYQELVLEHARNPRWEGPLEGATHEAVAHNPLCGDRVTVRLRLEDDVVRAVRFEARGCMIARASASILAELVEGKTSREASRLAALLHAVARDASPPADAGPLEPLRGVRQFPARVACVELAWSCLDRALGGR